MNEIGKEELLKDLELLKRLEDAVVVIRHDGMVHLPPETIKTLNKVGIRNDLSEQLTLEELDLILADKSIQMEDVKTIKIIRETILKDE
ncbi:MAG: hypothetical protein AAGL34_18390 [Bacteroidota bacterium]